MGIIPRFSIKTESDKVSHTVMAYLAIYTWAFSFVSFLWWFFYTYLGSQLLYWALMLACLLIAVVVALVSGSFYGGQGEWGKCFANMLCWTIDFGVWWGWCQVMTEVDGWAQGLGDWQEHVVNFGIVAGLIALTSIVYVCSSHEAMLKHDFERANPVPSDALAFGR